LVNGHSVGMRKAEGQRCLRAQLSRDGLWSVLLKTPDDSLRPDSVVVWIRTLLTAGSLCTISFLIRAILRVLLGWARIILLSCLEAGHPVILLVV
jgi:hypothetical protein